MVRRALFPALFLACLLPLPAFASGGRSFYLTVQSLNTEAKLARWIGVLERWKADRLVLYGLHKPMGGSMAVPKALSALRGALPELRLFAAGENAAFFRDLLAVRGMEGLFQGLHYEYEFWNYRRYRQPSREAAVAVLERNLRETRVQADELGLALELYVGWFTAAEAEILFPYLDSLLVHAYVEESAAAFPRMAERLELLSTMKKPPAWRILLSAEESFMGPELGRVGLDAAESAPRAAAAGRPGFSGVHWFTAEMAERVLFP